MNPSDSPGVSGLRSGPAAAFAGLTPRALRHYRRCGLVHPTQERSGYWLYSPAELARLVRIRALREVGLGLDEIGGLLDADVPVEALTEAFDTLRADLHHRAAVLAGMSETLEQLLTGAAAAQLAIRWRELAETSRLPAASLRTAAPGHADQGPLADLLASSPVADAIGRLSPRLRALRSEAPDSPDVDALAAELAASLPAALLPTAVTDGAMVSVLLGRQFSAAQLRCVIVAGRSAHAAGPAKAMDRSR